MLKVVPNDKTERRNKSLIEVLLLATISLTILNSSMLPTNYA
jgi:hypothetical protein